MPRTYGDERRDGSVGPSTTTIPGSRFWLPTRRLPT
jgi:hypothetical protein